MIYTPLYLIHKDAFDLVDLDPNKPAKIIPNEKATKEDLQSAFRKIAISENPSIRDNKDNALCKRMVEMFKENRIYNLKTEAEKKEIIDYLLAHPEIIELYTIQIPEVNC